MVIVFAGGAWADEPTFKTPEGKFITVEVENYVALLSQLPRNDDDELWKVQCMPVLAMAGKKHADKLEDDDELQLASACENADAVFSGTPTDPELGNRWTLEPLEAPVAEASFDIAEQTEQCAPADEVLQHFKRTLGGGLTSYDVAIDKDDVFLFLEANTEVEDELEMT